MKQVEVKILGIPIAPGQRTLLRGWLDAGLTIQGVPGTLWIHSINDTLGNGRDATDAIVQIKIPNEVNSDQLFGQKAYRMGREVMLARP